jgi:hypothetical protein
MECGQAAVSECARLGRGPALSDEAAPGPWSDDATRSGAGSVGLTMAPTDEERLVLGGSLNRPRRVGGVVSGLSGVRNDVGPVFSIRELEIPFAAADSTRLGGKQTRHVGPTPVRADCGR